MNIYLNGEAREVPDNYSAAQLVEELGLGGKRIAMEVNQEIVPRSRYAEHSLQAGDRVEVVHAIGGGTYISR
jgi:sulfur carrier protein